MGGSPSAAEVQAQVHTAVAAAEAAGVLLAQVARSGGARRVDHKGAVDLVTEADLAAEEAVRRVLAERCPGVPILAEEGGGAWSAPTRWIVDPLDGTTNFVHGLPHFAVSVALEHEGRLLAGCVLDVMRGECWSAGRGLGCFLGPRPVTVSATPNLDQALVATGFPYDRRQRAHVYLRLVEAVMRRAQGIRRAGAAALDLAWVAGGRLDAFWEQGLAPWDLAAGVLLVQEAGGRVSDFEGGPHDIGAGTVLATNRHVHEEMAQVLTPLVVSRPDQVEGSSS